MKALLMYPDRDFDPGLAPPWNEAALSQDLGLRAVVQAMSAGDPFLADIAHRAFMAGPGNDAATILHRQGVLQDCLRRPAAVRQLYELSVQAIEKKRRSWFGVFSSYAPGVLSSAADLMRIFVGMLREMKRVAARNAEGFRSDGFKALLATWEHDLDEEYLARIEAHLAELRFRGGALLSARLGESNEGEDYVLRKPRGDSRGWLARLLLRDPPGLIVRIADRDEAGARALGEIRKRGIEPVANALAQSVDHVLGFFEMLRAELAFYVGALNLHERLAGKGEPACFPEPVEGAGRNLRFSGLYDVGLALTLEPRVVGNTVAADGKGLVVVTGANQGGKSTFLRSVGQAQMMMQAGLFVGAEAFRGSLCPTLCTHYRREEDVTLKSGKLDEELSRMSEMADHLSSGAMVLFNESFAATNEREGSEIARQVVEALVDKGIRVFYVTHLHDFARSSYERSGASALFLRAERLGDGTRTFRVVEGRPEETSYGEDLYRQVFGEAPEPASVR